MDEGVMKKIDIPHLLAWLRFVWFLRSIRKDYDAVIALDKHWIFGFTLFLAGFPRRIGLDRLGKEGRFLTDRVFWNMSKREVEYYLDFLPAMGLGPADMDDQAYEVLSGNSPKKREIDEWFATLQKTQSRIVAVSTGGGNALSPTGDCRWWSLEKWTELTKRLLDQGDTVILFGADSDRKLTIDHPNFHDRLGKFALLDTIYALSKADFAICQESGFMHFVGCTATPMVALAGPTNPERFYPKNSDGSWHPSGWIWKMEKECYDVWGGYGNCRGDEMDKIEVEDVMKALQTL
jgi:ADP-heptose:LPS heptosyltransferase